jgi:hypothetical protein
MHVTMALQEWLALGLAKRGFGAGFHFSNPPTGNPSRVLHFTNPPVGFWKMFAGTQITHQNT